jgi:uncharacterized protein YgiM (DUF1202 family)
MKLKQYLQENKITQNEFIMQLEKSTGHKLSQGGLSKYVIAKRIPRKSEMLAIHDYTEGAVSPNDFYLDQSS